jgi:hypothetical protein
MKDFANLAATAKHAPQSLDPYAVRSAMLRAERLEDALSCLSRCGTLSVARHGDETELSFTLRLDSETADDLLVVLLDLHDLTPLVRKEDEER